MTTEKRASSELLEAAVAFDDELVHFARLTEAVRRGPLNSQKNLQRAAGMFQEIGDAEQRLGEAAQALVGALNAARQKQEVQVLAVKERAQEIEARSAVAADLLRRYGAMGEKATELNALVLQIGEKSSNGTPPGASLLPALGELRARMGEVADGAEELVAAAREADFEDIARQADALRQQVVAADGKVAAVERSLGGK